MSILNYGLHSTFYKSLEHTILISLLIDNKKPHQMVRLLKLQLYFTSFTVKDLSFVISMVPSSPLE